ncbi:MAG: hypothetical protein IM551_06800 [Chitinophagaceae bacterium]|nr:hypothetical protein [Chitinophagaceae bacterium]
MYAPTRHFLPALLLTVFFLFSFLPTQSQTIAAKSDTIPAFHLQLIDSSFYISNQHSQQPFLAIIYFSPDCGHCIDLTEELIGKADSLSNTLILLAAYKTLDDLRAFSQRFQLNRFPFIRVGQDISYAIVPYYRIAYTPLVALYGPDRRLAQIWRYPEQPFRLREFLQIIQTK